MSFPVSVEELQGLHDPKSLLHLKSLGGADKLFSDLDTDIVKGLPIDVPDQAERQRKFGENRIPSKPGKTFFQLCWEALQDKVLIMLSVAAVISLALGLYETFGQPTEYDEEGNPLPKVEWVEGVAIMAAVIIVVLVGAVNDYQKERQFAKLNSKKEDRNIIVYRDGVKEVISVYDLVVGDLIALETGDIIPADAILVDGACECDESALTGETNTIKKVTVHQAFKIYEEEFENVDSHLDIGTSKFPDSMMISGSKVLSGVGKATVTAVGPNSMHGRTLLSLKGDAESTPLQTRLSNLADGIANFGFLAAFLFLVLFIRFLCLLPLGHRYHDLTPSEKGTRFLDIIITAITIIVVAVPEGLPLAVTLALAFATTRMAKDGNLVRHLAACETMGGATAVCSDKTGTLTLNKMRVVRGLLADEEFNNTSHADDGLVTSSQIVSRKSVPKDILALIEENIILNSSAFTNKQIDGGDLETNQILNPPRRKHWYSLKKTHQSVAQTTSDPYIGSKTETALLILLEESFESFTAKSLEEIRQDNNSSIVQVIPFESSRKWGGVVCKYADGYRFYIKGASELVFSRCNSKSSSDSSVVQITPDLRLKLNDKIESYAKDALRTLSIAHRDLPGLSSWPPKELVGDNPDEADPMKLFGDAVDTDDIPFDQSNPNDSVPIIVVEAENAIKGSTGLILDAIVGIQDPLRPGVPEAVKQCQSAGVTVRMVTGDNLTTAKAISLSCNILKREELDDPWSHMEGPAFRKLSDRERYKIVPHLRVLARSSPDDKRILVQTLKDMNEVVAVTGDGTNDAPLLKLADVGFSMGIAGTEVARELSDIILMTDDFTAIVNAIKWGRTVLISIRKFIQFQLTVNVTAVVLTFVSSVASSEGDSVLTAVQLLWVNLIMDTLAALALATDKPDDSFLKMKPAGRSKPLITVSMWKMIFGQAILQLIITFVLHFAGAQIFFGTSDVSDHQNEQLAAMTFNTFVWLQFFCLFAARKLDEGDGLKTMKERFTLNNLNFFLHLFRNMYFIVIALIIGGFQVLIMFVGGSAFSIVRSDGPMWGTAIICGLLSLPAAVLIRTLPDEPFVKYFPTTVYRYVMYILTFKFLRKGGRRPQNPGLLDEDVEMSPLYEFSPFLKARDEIIHLKEDSTLGPYSPIKLYRDWRRRSSSSINSSNVSTLVESNSESGQGSSRESEQDGLALGLSALLMVPAVVGGAVGGWHVGSPKKGQERELV